MMATVMIIHEEYLGQLWIVLVAQGQGAIKQVILMLTPLVNFSEHGMIAFLNCIFRLASLPSTYSAGLKS